MLRVVLFHGKSKRKAELEKKTLVKYMSIK